MHLVRAANGMQALRTFAQAMRCHDPGIEYELVLAMKGFPSPSDAAVHLEEVTDLVPHVLHFPDVGFDLGVFLAAAARLRRARYCFLNSWSYPVNDGWLAKLNGALDLPDVGMVGATGSWGSNHSLLTYRLGLPSAYRGILPPRRTGWRALREMELELRGDVPDEKPRPLRERLRLLAGVPEILLDFEPFPNPHLRTPAFMVPHRILTMIKLFVIGNDKLDAYALESGRTSITRQVERMGKHVLVVDREASVYCPREWDRSETYRQGNQEGLLIADRRTLEYQNGNLAQRHLMSRFCWGTRADPQGLVSSAHSQSDVDTLLSGEA